MRSPRPSIVVLGSAVVAGLFVPACEPSVVGFGPGTADDRTDGDVGAGDVDDGGGPDIDVDAGPADGDVDAGGADGDVDGGSADVDDAGTAEVVDAGSDDTVDAGAVDPPPPPRGPAELLVLTANVENLPRTGDACPGDFRDLYAYLAVEDLRPDVFVVQQLSGQAQLQELLVVLSNMLSRPYDGRVAEADPTPFDSPCGAQKERQTNAVVFATDRLQLVGEPVVRRSYKNVDGACVLDSLSRTRTIALLLRDTVTGEDISATSLHWSTRNGPGPDPACATANARELDQLVRVHHGGASLSIAGGDTNEPDLVEHTVGSAPNPWYAEMNVDLGGALGWIDPIWRHCERTGALRDCLLDQWTFRGQLDRRIDFVFARRTGAPPAVLQAHTITFNEAGAADAALTGSDSDIAYSDHRAVLARLRY
jgi:hypothetical protein